MATASSPRRARVPGRTAYFSARVAALRARASAGDASAWWALGCLLGDGDVDARGRVSTPPDHRGAFMAFRRGVDLGDASALLNPYSREGASYLRAVILLDRGRPGDAPIARSLLRRAATDRDYPEAEAMLRALEQDVVPVPCRCRRHWKRTVGGQAPCSRHPTSRRLQNAGRHDGRS